MHDYETTQTHKHTHTHANTNTRMQRDRSSEHMTFIQRRINVDVTS